MPAVSGTEKFDINLSPASPVLVNVEARGNKMKKNYVKPTLLKRQKLSSVTAQACPVSQCVD